MNVRGLTTSRGLNRALPWIAGAVLLLGVLAFWQSQVRGDSNPETFSNQTVTNQGAQKTVDLAPALVLGAQVIFGALFGIMGLALADPLVAMMKAALDQKSVDDEAAEAETPPPRLGLRR